MIIIYSTDNFGYKFIMVFSIFVTKKLKSEISTYLHIARAIMVQEQDE